MSLMKLTYRFHEGVLAVGTYTGKEVQVLNQYADYETALSLGWLPEQTLQFQVEHCALMTGRRARGADRRSGTPRTA
jgi:hypothetical protein